MNSPTDVMENLRGYLDEDALAALSRQSYLRLQQVLKLDLAQYYDPNLDWQHIYSIFMLAIKEGEDYPNAKWIWGWLLLQSEALAEPIVVRIILERLSQDGLQGDEAIDTCVQKGYTTSLELLLSSPEVYLSQERLDYALVDAVAKNNREALQLLLRDGRADPLAHGHMIESSILRYHSDEDNYVPIIILLLRDGRIRSLFNYDSLLNDAINGGHEELALALESLDRRELRIYR